MYKFPKQKFPFSSSPVGAGKFCKLLNHAWLCAVEADIYSHYLRQQPFFCQGVMQCSVSYVFTYIFPIRLTDIFPIRLLIWAFSCQYDAHSKEHDWLRFYRICPVGFQSEKQPHFIHFFLRV